MHFKFLSAVAAAFLLAACQSSTTGTGGVDGDGRSSSTIGNNAALCTQEDVTVNLGDRVFFDYDRHALKPQGRQLIENWANYFKECSDLTAVIEGHADERGTREYNLALGNRRANATMEYLAALGVASDRLSIISFGKERPAVLGSSENAYAQNRRGVLVVD